MRRQPGRREEWKADDLHLQAALLAALDGLIPLEGQVAAADEGEAEVAAAEALVAAAEARVLLTSPSRK